MTDHSELDAKIAALGIEYKAEFVPQRLSRNSGEKNPSLNWRVTLARGGRVLSTDYMQGIGHVPGYYHGPLTIPGTSYRWPEAVTLRLEQEHAANSGKYPVFGKQKRAVKPDDYKPLARHDIGLATLPPPLLRDVLYCLVSDADVLNYEGFEDWASNYGYEEDSRKAERIYRDCCAFALKLQSLIGRKALDELREAFQDY